MFALVDDLWVQAGLNPSAAAVIERLYFYHGGSARSGDLLGNPIRSTPAMGYVLASLKSKQLVTRRQDDNDRRVVVVARTPAARELYAEMVERILDRVVGSAATGLNRNAQLAVTWRSRWGSGASCSGSRGRAPADFRSPSAVVRPQA